MNKFYFKCEVCNFSLDCSEKITFNGLVTDHLFSDGHIKKERVLNEIRNKK